MTRLSITAIASAVSSGARSAESVIAQALEAIAAYDEVQAHAWIMRPDPQTVLTQARAVDARVAAGERLPLAGVPFAVKDNIDVAGLPTTAACPAYAYDPEDTATVAARLLAAGAICMGKTNLDQFATGLVGARSPYGAPACVYNLAYVSGGSSSGSAVAVAAGLVAFALGTDTAGSGRVPAAFNGLIGFKPTKGRWSTSGVVPACRSLDCVTVLANDVADAALVDSVVAAFDPSDTYSRRAPSATDLLGASFRFGVPKADQLIFMGDDQAQAIYARAVERVTAMGGVTVEIDIEPLLEAAKLLYSGPWVAERTAAIETLLRETPAAVNPTVRAILQGGFGVTGVDTFRGLYALADHARAAEAIWPQVDVLLLPTTPTIYRLAEVTAEPFALNGALGLYTNFVNLLDMSAIAVPAGFRDNDTGFGVTLVGQAWADDVLLDLARRYEEISPMPDAPALDTAGKPQTVKLAVVGAHLAGMPLHWQLTSRDAKLVSRTKTAPAYKLFAMTNTTPFKPALIHVGEGGGAIEVEVYELGVEAFGSFVVEVPAPLAIGTVTLEGGGSVKGFVAEPRAIVGAEDITALGGWRAYIAGLPA
ncbi:MAG: allophanate hydrolase [Phenylobacterium sp.]|uniref:allophanate hydrolase n=1 Tax=Phenylobacterium sp. TaxID=1871053 RepID=UPI001B73172E|nr:allophanate hydrolase [Phenylobacterium sp.]MBP7648767.1 allophanate hydrolase [Phenylobacterium sp.]MBP7817066.1 allophanate hydrolase [Phenylobacterium sp.]MBP9230811.1 allophanate hydrolase [Phenylobacterium sp.]MBP9753532.1 allophanate hydrolase [Phenylobacterium sp.]